MFTFHAESGSYQALILLKGQDNDIATPELLLLEQSALQEEFLDCFLHKRSILPTLDPTYWTWKIDNKRVRLADPTHRLLFMFQENIQPTMKEVRQALIHCTNPLLFERLFELTLTTKRQRSWMQQYDLDIMRILQGKYDPDLEEAVSVLFLIPWEESLELSPQSLLDNLEQDFVPFAEEQASPVLA